MPGINHFYTGMNISPPSSSNVVICYINHQQLFINFAVQQQQTSNRRHHHGKKNILAFTISTILTLVQMRYAQEDLFETHHFVMVVVLSSVLAYCLPFSLLGRLLLVMRPSVNAGTASDEHDCHAYMYKWCHIIMLLFGSLSVASLLWLLLFPHFPSWRPVLYLVLIFLFSLVVLVLASKLVPAVGKFFSPVCRGQNRCRRTSPFLPLSTVDLSQR
ncbi:unnamed protein product [Prunus armeniaca]|uniref:Uncharacterized protein n=1 Tax=Prunus armeniaca TaxID=36596 RepID=A0A6J5U259_PRUAR|nr:unnamed protein product [Prunus armeniaca]CAB4269707.1 unnamed protein product [Prunus armeniaca]